ncbi:hypothetical protein LCGC14_0315960 [marine sediment metagenome]|uniref:Uncharacterized protein n=1 Tax=marine sediment metagenome TaxID=412755 RepID=A0A0F9TQQ5_9ZZZZ
MNTRERLGQVMQKVAGGKLSTEQRNRLGTWAEDTFNECDIRKIVCPPEYEALGIAQAFLGGTRRDCPHWNLSFIYNGRQLKLYWNGETIRTDCLMWTIQVSNRRGSCTASFKTLGDVINHLVERHHND